MPIDNIEPKISTELRALLDKLKGAATTSRYLLIKIYEQGKTEGLTNEEIRNLIIFSISPLLSDRTIRKLLPLELKKHRMIRYKSLRHVLPQVTSDTQEKRKEDVGKATQDTDTKGSQDERSSNNLSQTDVAFTRAVTDFDVKGNASQLLLVKDKVIESLEQRVREKDLTIQQLKEDNEKLNEKAKLWAGGTVKFKIGVTPVWREFILLRNSNVINAYMVFDGKSFLRFEPISNI